MKCMESLGIQGRWIRTARIADGYDFVDDPEAALAEIRKTGKRVDLFTFTQRLSEPTPKYSYHWELENTAALPITTYDRWFKEQIRTNTRNKLRKAEKAGVTAREVPFNDELIAGIARINDESPVRQGRLYWHFGDDHETVRQKNVTFLERSIFIGIFHQENLIGYGKLVIDETKQQAGLMQILSMISHRDKAPNNILIAQAVKSCAERGIPYLWYAKFSYGKKQRDGLSDFKEQNGFIAIHTPRYYIPLTLVGRLALPLGLHRAVQEHIPWAILDPVRRARKFWLSRRLESLSQRS